MLLTERNATVIDVRTPPEFDEVHATLPPPATLANIPLDELDPAALAISGRASADRPVYLLCRSGTRATRAAGKFAAAGFRQPVVITGGTLAWIDAGLPVTRGQSRVISLERQVRIAAGSLVAAGAILGWFVHPAFIWLSGFVGAGLVFAGITDFCGLGLLLAKCPWNRRRNK
ncbi:YgaP-like transmembrane domain [Geminisphaera colitermitum]|uniref:YgaP-like transmembrane domain n=1 Tax=Geminisphaera colitermitum TaxID=1148786 RepID=UPI000158CB38